jgi:DNA primase catalytic subunit
MPLSARYVMGQNVIADQLREYYSHNPPDLKFITDINKRHFRFLLPNGRFFKIKDTIHSPQNLQKWLVKLQPLDVYYSTSTYLNPTSVASRPKKSSDYWGPGNVILSHDLAFDIDRRPLSLFNLERARKDAIRLLDFLFNNNYILKYAAFSGSKGFHLLFDDIEKKIEPDFRLREKSIIMRRKTLVDEIVKDGIKIDASVTVDTRRIIRLPGTINSKTGYCCQPLSIDELRSPIVDWIDRIPSLEDHTAIPRFKMKRLPKHKRTNQHAIMDKEVGYGYTTFITSSVLGTRGRHAVLLSLPKGSQEMVMHTLRRVQSMYDLTDFYLFELPRTYQAICLKTVQRNRYQKILDYVHSPSAHQLRNYNRVSLRMGPLVNQNMQVLEPPAQFITFLECSSVIRDNNFVSRGHINFLKKHGLTPLEYCKIHGNDEFKLVDAELRL